MQTKIQEISIFGNILLETIAGVNVSNDVKIEMVNEIHRKLKVLNSGIITSDGVSPDDVLLLHTLYKQIGEQKVPFTILTDVMKMKIRKMYNSKSNLVDISSTYSDKNNEMVKYIKITDKGLRQESSHLG